MPMPSLHDLLAALPDYVLDPALLNPAITQVTADSRQVHPGALFVAMAGGAVDGHRFIGDAAARGAAAVVAAADGAAWPAPAAGLPIVRVPSPRAALATLAAAFYGFPSRRLRVVGVTGTDGKTTTSHLITHVLRTLGLHPGLISTVSAVIGGRNLDTGLHVTTPDAPDVQRYLAAMVDAGCQAAVLESTSHGLHQGRVNAVDFDVAVVTNVTHEHLDYHGTWEAYLDAKALLLRSLGQSAYKPLAGGGVQPKTAVLNLDDASYPHLRAIPADRTLSYSLHSREADLWASDVSYRSSGVAFRAHTPAGEVEVALPLPGEFNVANALAALAAGLALGLAPADIAAALATTPGVDGRMERIERGQDFVAIVDFAHTPGSLQRSLQAARQLTTGRVLAVFGSAGLRDVQKRGWMAEIAVRLADWSVFTAEDPRVESLDAILEQMAAGAQAAGGVEGRNFVRIPDRSAAILAAVMEARAGDVVLVCGKGHEQSMCFGVTEYPWRDQIVLAWALDRRLGSAAGDAPFWLPTMGGDDQPERQS